VNSLFLPDRQVAAYMVGPVLPVALAASADLAAALQFVVRYRGSSRAPARDSPSAMAEQGHLGVLPALRVPQLRGEQ